MDAKNKVQVGDENYDNSLKKINKLISNYAKVVKQELFERWNLFPLNFTQQELYEVVISLLASHANLSIQLIYNPTSWNPYIAPIILRTQVDSYISLAWILSGNLYKADIRERYNKRVLKFIEYGLGQEKLHIAHLENSIKASGGIPTFTEVIECKINWLNSQKYESLTEVNLGNWSDKSSSFFFIKFWWS